MSTEWITDRPPNHTDTGPNERVWVWSPVGACALAYGYSSRPAGRPWAPGHQPPPTTAPELRPEPLLSAAPEPVAKPPAVPVMCKAFDDEFHPLEEIPEPIRTGACPFYVLVISDDAGSKPHCRIQVVWEHEIPEGITLRLALQQKQLLGGRYGTTYLVQVPHHPVDGTPCCMT